MFNPVTQNIEGKNFESIFIFSLVKNNNNNNKNNRLVPTSCWGDVILEM